MWTTPAGARPSGSSMTIAKLFVPSGAPDQASGGEIFSPTQFGLRCLSAQAFLTASWSLSFKAEEVSTSTSARAAPNDRAKAPANNKLPRAYFMMSSLSVRCHSCPVPAGSGHGTVLVKDATASPNSKARQILVRFHDTLPRRDPTRPTIGLTVISGYGGSFALLRLPTTVPSLIISRTFPPGGLWRLPMPRSGHSAIATLPKRAIAIRSQLDGEAAER